MIKLGDRVELVLSPNPFHSMKNGLVVLYRGKHSRTSPRVRWESGWGVTSRAKELRLQTGEELLRPPPATYAGDEGDKIIENYWDRCPITIDTPKDHPLSPKSNKVRRKKS